MARIFIDSFETQNLGLWDTTSGTPTIVSTTGLDMKGNYCLECGANDYIWKYLSEKNEYYFAFKFRMTSTSAGYVIYLYHTGTMLMRISNGANLYYNVGGGGGAGSQSLAINTTYFMQLYFKVANSGGRCLAKIDNIVDYDFTGDTQPGSDTTINRARFGDRTYIDNFIIDDSEEIEETEICLLKPNGIGNSSNWTPTSGDNYTCVDEVPYNDTDYVSENVADAIDTYIVENSPGDLVSVKCIQAQTRTRKDSDSLLNNMNLVVRSGINYHGSDESLTTSFVDKIKIWEKNPADSQDWEKADIDAMEIGVRART